MGLGQKQEIFAEKESCANSSRVGFSNSESVYLKVYFLKLFMLVGDLFHPLWSLNLMKLFSLLQKTPLEHRALHHCLHCL